jgi:hypothetical protein
LLAPSLFVIPYIPYLLCYYLALPPHTIFTVCFLVHILVCTSSTTFTSQQSNDKSGKINHESYITSGIIVITHKIKEKNNIHSGEEKGVQRVHWGSKGLGRSEEIYLKQKRAKKEGSCK